MAIVLLALNGIGLGHLSRLAEIAACLHSAGEKPVLFYQSVAYPYARPDFQAIGIQSLRKCSDDYRLRVQDGINMLCSVAGPHIFIEDTHPSNLRIRQSTRQFLVVRPTTFAYLVECRRIYERYYTGFLIADEPDSPTWPYTEEETAEIRSWKKFCFIGPVFRTAGDDDIESLRYKYGWQPDRPFFVFSMGGGGQQAGANDTERFLDEAIVVAHKIRERHPRARLLFVKGPLYKEARALPEIFESIDSEKNLPALFALAQGAVIRPGFNAVWECIHAGTPFYYIQGTVFSEPVGDKMMRLARFGLADNDKFLDDDYTVDYKNRCAEIADRWNGQPNASFAEAIEKAKAPHEALMEAQQAPESFSITTRSQDEQVLSALPATRPRRLFLRLDDVVSVTEEVDFVLSLAKRYGFFTSVEVIPYLSSLREKDLEPYDDGQKNIVVSQHGYCHALNLHNPQHIRSEFTFSGLPPKEDLNNLRAGRAYMQAVFPNRYHNGFSAPFDQFPGWLPKALADHGWQYMLANTDRSYFGVPLVRVRSDIWNWGYNGINSSWNLFNDIAASINRYHYCGMILHPQHFRMQEHRRFLEYVLAQLAGKGFGSYNVLHHLQPVRSLNTTS